MAEDERTSVKMLQTKAIGRPSRHEVLWLCELVERLDNELAEVRKELAEAKAKDGCGPMTPIDRLV